MKKGVGQGVDRWGHVKEVGHYVTKFQNCATSRKLKFGIQIDNGL